jgi:hypothetical protein
MSNIGRIVDDDGQVIGAIQEGDRIVRKATVEHLKDTEVWSIEHFYKGNMDEVRKQLESLSVYEKAFLFCIVSYVGYEDCCIKYDNGNCIGFDDLVKLSRMGRTKTLNTINELIKKDIIYKGKNSKGLQYFINPWLFCRGKRIDVVLKTMFKNYRIKVRNGVKWSEL